MSDGEIEAELSDSRRMIEAKLARPVEFFLIPTAMSTSGRSRRAPLHRAAVICKSGDARRPTP